MQSSITMKPALTKALANAAATLGANVEVVGFENIPWDPADSTEVEQEQENR
jgi:hypothetical protein